MVASFLIHKTQNAKTHINTIISQLCHQRNIQMHHSLRNLQGTYKH